MQAFNLDHQPAKLVNITIREELKDERGLPDVYLKFVCRLSAATLVAFHPELRSMLYKDGPQADLEGGSGVALRFPELGKQKISRKIKDARFVLHYGVGESNGASTEPVSEATQLDKFVVDAHESDIKAAYRRLASALHPDRGGDVARMAEVNLAYSMALSDRS